MSMIYYGFLFQLQNAFKSHFNTIILACDRSASVWGGIHFTTHVRDKAFVFETPSKIQGFSAKQLLCCWFTLGHHPFIKSVS